MSALTDLHEEIRRCRECELARYRTTVVPGEGREDADIMFIGEAPGWHEDQQGRPFVGPAGRFLEELLASIGMRREDVFIGNVLKCRPPGNRDPLPAEMETCRRWLDRQIELISPKIVVTLGRYSMARFFPGEAISKVHGKPRRIGSTVCFPMYHPAAALHQQSLRQVIEADMLQIPGVLEDLSEPVEVEQKPQQLSMF